MRRLVKWLLLADMMLSLLLICVGLAFWFFTGELLIWRIVPFVFNAILAIVLYRFAL